MNFGRPKFPLYTLSLTHQTGKLNPQNAPDSNMSHREFGKGEGGSSYAHIPDHVKQAKANGSGFSGTRSV